MHKSYYQNKITEQLAQCITQYHTQTFVDFSHVPQVIEMNDNKVNKLDTKAKTSTIKMLTKEEKCIPCECVILVNFILSCISL